jgi:hypothetical protein
MSFAFFINSYVYLPFIESEEYGAFARDEKFALPALERYERKLSRGLFHASHLRRN